MRRPVAQSPKSASNGTVGTIRIPTNPSSVTSVAVVASPPQTSVEGSGQVISRRSWRWVEQDGTARIRIDVGHN